MLQRAPSSARSHVGQEGGLVELTRVSRNYFIVSGRVDFNGFPELKCGNTSAAGVGRDQRHLCQVHVPGAVMLRVWWLLVAWPVR